MRTSVVSGKLHARELLEELWNEQGRPHVDKFFPVDVDAVVRQIGWKLEEVAVAAYSHDPRERVQGYCEASSKTIFLSTDIDKTPEHRRFTIAHEIGHAILHGGSPHPHYRKLPPSTRTRKRTPKPPQEVEANAFAAELLMPERTVRRAFKDLFGRDELWIGSEEARRIAGLGVFDTPELQPVAKAIANYVPLRGKPSLAGYFGVSAEAMGVRLEVLQLVHV